ncbi:outer membrane protein assembly factor BamB family protein [Baekduia sp. Peel2402]|uniref:outer membrane protein assembly factor BamB family protein n=1 Tax=Baekduia sp. Peel2402 TaxID=3458296 RepID=UPI00403E5302
MNPKSMQRAPKAALLGAGALALILIVVIVLLVTGGGGDDGSDQAAAPPASSTPDQTQEQPGGNAAKATFEGDALPNYDLSSTRNAKGSKINASNVKSLKSKWTIALGQESQSQFGSYASTPVVVNGVVYSQDLASNVSAIDLKSGDVLWTKSYASPDQGPNGVNVGGGKVFGVTADSAFALDQKTGKELWKKELIRNAGEGLDMAPGYYKGLVYASTVPGNNGKFYGGGTKGILWALDAETGKKVWKFDTAPTKTWSKNNEEVNLGGGLWYAPSFDQQGNMYFGVGNAGPFPGTTEHPWGSSRPGKNLYTNSVVKLNAKTGKLKWYYQATPHDLYDWDFQNPPILATVKGKPAVIGSGKNGYVIALDRANGKVLWKRAVGKHNGHDKDPVYASKGQYSKLALNQEIYPGRLGGVIAPASTDGKLIFVGVVNNSVTYTANEKDAAQDSQTSTGELVAVDLDTGKIKWAVNYNTSVFGSTTVSNDVVFSTTFDGQIHASDAKTGKPLWDQQLPASSNSGVTVHDNVVIAAAGLAAGQGQTPSIAAYSLDGK